MSTGIETTIRRHLEANDSLQTPIGRTEIVERIDTETRTVPVPTRGIGYGVWVAVGAAVVTLILVGGVSLLTRVQEAPVTDSVIPTTLVAPSVVVPPPPTPPPATIVPTPASIIGPPVTQLPLTFTGSGVRSFEGTVRQTAFRHSGAEESGIDGLAEMEWEEAAVRIEVFYGGPGRSFRAEIVDAPQSPSRQVLDGALFGLDYLGSFRVVDAGTGIHGFYGAEGVLVRRPESYDPFRALVWNHPGSASWEKLCERTNQEVTAQGEVAGQLAHVVVCEGVDDTWTVWVDAETGLVLKLDHETTAVGVPTVGDFEFETLRYDPIFSADAFGMTAPPGSEVYDEESMPPLPILDPNIATVVPEVPIDTWQPWGSDVAGLNVGEPFPAFTATLLGGGTFDVAADRDKPLVLLTWYATSSYIDAGPGAVEIDALNLVQAYYDRYGDTIDFVAVVKPYSPASPEIVELIRESHGYTLPIATNPDPFEIREIMWVLIGTNGNVLAADCGCDGAPREVLPQLIAEALAAEK